ncbi:alcohol dehydrogenase catalytic domain-containing protein [Phytohabitans flavus]|uniref:alcohol dehydrogenase catalytic domain-containing protein n=1 Tax=Phytohabitans flavus TaxID=1076124 RepID=UPI00363D78C6
MYAVVIDDFGLAPSLRELPEPVPGPGEVKVRVAASSVNGFDRLLAAGALRGIFEHRFPIVLGKDFAGMVAAVGRGSPGSPPAIRSSVWWRRPTRPTAAASANT